MDGYFSEFSLTLNKIKRSIKTIKRVLQIQKIDDERYLLRAREILELINVKEMLSLSYINLN